MRASAASALHAQSIRPLELIKAEKRLLTQQSPRGMQRRQGVQPPQAAFSRNMVRVAQCASDVPQYGVRVPATAIAPKITLAAKRILATL
jgi:hypothetical protein